MQHTFGGLDKDFYWPLEETEDAISDELQWKGYVTGNHVTREHISFEKNCIFSKMDFILPHYVSHE